MNRSKLRRRIAWEAARLMYQRQESEYYRAKWKAARRICRGWVKPSDLPSNAEVRDEILALARLHEGGKQLANLRDMRIDALRMMHALRRFRPRLIGSVMTGHVRAGSDIDLHVFSDSIEAITLQLDEDGCIYDVERKRVRKGGEVRSFTHIHVRGRFPFELTVYAADEAHHVFRSSITGKPMERASIAEFEQFLAREYPDMAVDKAVADVEKGIDRFQVFQSLLLPLERVEQSKIHHPEGDALYHSLQVFDLARDALPYDQEFLEAALLHDVGKAIDSKDHVAAGLDALAGFITPRTHWLIAFHMHARQLLDGELGLRARRRLRASEDFEELMTLARCDRDGRQRGVETPDIDEAIDYLRDLERTFGTA
ncbi:MAG: tRNA adenylyltransferase [Planctomycetes bacterium]|nr:tRNA adenylyltransferase [Planctomycetota bacterium]